MFTDLHCHPLLKCYGKNCHRPTKHPQNEASLFFHKPFSRWNQLIENLTTITSYRQSDFVSAIEGDTIVLGFSMYAPEKDFFPSTSKKHDNPFLENAITHFGIEWIEEIQSDENDYFETLKQQFKFVKKMNGEPVKIGNNTYRYRIIQSGQELKDALESKQSNTVFLIYNIEGGHNLFHQVDAHHDTSQTIDPESISFLKSKAPLYVTLAHHFYNQLTGHCISFPNNLSKFIDQKYGTNLGLRPQGEKVIRQLLSTDNGPRILIDIKHMNPKARNQYYAILDELNAQSSEKIPIIFSHGGVNGISHFTENKSHPTEKQKEIGLYDDEIIRLVQSGGLFGLNLDQRVMALHDDFKTTNSCRKFLDRYCKTSKLVWDNVEHFVNVCATNNLNPWPHICIGSDYDGIINPINGFWTLSYMPRLKKYFKKHLHHFLSKNPDMDFDMNEKDIINGIFSRNMTDFIIKHYNPNHTIV